MRIITDKQDRFGNFPIWFYSRNLRDINDYLQHHYDGYKFAIVIDCTLGEIAPLEKPLPVYFFGDIAKEVAQEADKVLLDKKEYQKLTERNTPLKPIMIGDEHSSVLSCASCKQPIVNVYNSAEYKPQYCHYCGQRLDWGIKD